MNKCSQCHCPIQSDQKFCTKCGAPLANLVAALMPGKLQAGIDVCEKAISREPGNPHLYMEFGDLLLEFNLYDKALTQYQKAAEVDETCLEALLKSGDVCLKMGKFEEARGSYADSLKITPDLMEARVGLFWALKGLNRLDEAEKLGEDIIKNEPDLLPIRKGLRDLYQLKNEDEKVIRENLKIISLVPSECEPYKQLAQVCEKRSDIPLAMEIYRKILELDPQDQDALSFIGSKSYQEGEYEEAIRCFELILRKNADHTKARILLSLSYIGIGSYDQAIRTLSVISDRNLTVTDEDGTDLSRAYYLIGACRLREGIFPDAKNYLTSSLKFRKSEAAEKTLSHVYATEGDQALSRKSYENAKHAFISALELDSGNGMLRDKLQQVQKHLRLRRMVKAASALLAAGCLVFFSILYYGPDASEKRSGQVVTDSRKDMEKKTTDISSAKSEVQKLFIINKDVYLRQSPGARALEAGTLEADTRVSLIESGNGLKDTWNGVRVESGPLQGKVGYVRKSYLSETINSAAVPIQKSAQIFKIKKDVYLRQSPGSGTPEVGTLEANTKVSLIGSGKDRKGTIWNEVRVESGALQGKAGYVRKSYLAEQ